MAAKPEFTHGQQRQHRLDQYMGLTLPVVDQRSKSWVKRGASEDDDPARARAVEEILAKYRKEEE